MAVTNDLSGKPIKTVREASGMLISEVLRILDARESPPREPAVAVGEPFSAMLSAQGRDSGATALAEVPGGSGPTAAIQNPVPAKAGAELFPVGRPGYDNFLRALKESNKPRGSHHHDQFK